MGLKKCSTQLFQEIFAQVMTSVIEAAKTATTTKFVLIPSHHDAHHKFIYPTPPFPNTHNEEVSSFYRVGLVVVDRVELTYKI